MSARRRALKDRKKRQENDFQDVEKLLGLWKDVEGARVLIRVRRAVTGEFMPKNSIYQERTVSLFADLIKYEKVSGMTDVESFPHTLKMHLPNRETYMARTMVRFGRNKKGKIRSIVIRGKLMYDDGSYNSGQTQPKSIVPDGAFA